MIVYLLTIIDTNYISHYYLDSDTNYIWYSDTMDNIELSTYNETYYLLNIENVVKPNISSFVINEQGCIYYFNKIKGGMEQLIKNAVLMKILNSI